MKNRLLSVIFFVIIISCKYGFAQCTANFSTVPSVTEGCEVFGVQFTSLVSGQTLGTPSWSFGDGTSNFNGNNPFHNFVTKSKDTSYVVSLSVNCLNGTTSKKTSVIKVNAKPSAQFDLPATELCAFRDTLLINNQSSAGNGFVYNWDFGDNSISTLYLPKYVYNTNGIFEISLEVTNAKGCKSKIRKSVTVKQSPNPQFTIDNFIGCTPLFTTAINTTENSSSFQITDWIWTTSEGITFNGIEPPQFTFSKSNLNEIKLTAINNLGCSNSTSANVFVKPSPEISSSSIPSGTLCYNSPINVSIVTNPQEATVVWISNGSASFSDLTSKSISVNFADGGDQEIVARLSNNGCSKDTVFKFKIQEKPQLTLSYAPLDICEQDNITVTATPDNLSSYLFKLNGKLVTSSSNTLALNNIEIDNNIVVEAKDNAGCQVITNLSIAAKDKPNLSIVSSAQNKLSCFGEPLNFTIEPAGLDEYSYEVNGIEKYKGSLNTFRIDSLDQNVVFRVKATKNGCSDQKSESVSFKVPSSAPVINCAESDINFIKFAFENVSNASAISLSINGEPFKSIPIGNGYTLTDLKPNQDYEATINVTLDNETPCTSIKLSSAKTCKTIPCPPMSFVLTPTVSQICEGKGVTLQVDSILTPSGTYKLYWEGVKGENLSYKVDSLTAQLKPYEYEVILEDTTRSKECASISKKAQVYVLKVPEKPDFLCQYGKDPFCKADSTIIVSILNYNPEFTYQAKYGPETYEFDSPSLRFLLNKTETLIAVESSNPLLSICTSSDVKTVKLPVDSTLILKVDSLTNFSFDTTGCSTWTITVSTNFDLEKLKQIEENLANAQTLNLYRFINKVISKDRIDKDIKTNQYSKPWNIIVPTYDFTLDPGQEVFLTDSVVIVDSNNCTILISVSKNYQEQETLCEHPKGKSNFCVNKNDSIITIDFLQKKYECLGVYKRFKQKFEKSTVKGFIYLDSLTIQLDKSYYGDGFFNVINEKATCFEFPFLTCNVSCDTSWYIPNAISPNGDRKNDKWELMFLRGKVKVRITNRWETIVYESDDYKNDFEGISNQGVVLTDGVYFYEIETDAKTNLPLVNDKSISTLEEAKNRAYSVNSYSCERLNCERIKGKLLIQR